MNRPFTLTSDKYPYCITFRLRGNSPQCSLLNMETGIVYHAPEDNDLILKVIPSDEWPAFALPLIRNVSNLQERLI